MSSVLLGNGDGTPDDYDLSVPEERRAFLDFIKTWWATVKSLKAVDYKEEDPELEKMRQDLVRKAEEIKKMILEDQNIVDLLREFNIQLEAVNVRNVVVSVYKVVDAVKDWAATYFSFTTQEKKAPKAVSKSKVRMNFLDDFLGMMNQLGKVYALGQKLAVFGAIGLSMFVLNSIIKVSDR